MAVVTMNGPIGSGTNEVGVHAARLLHADYVDRLVLAEAAKRIGSTVEVLEIKGLRKLSLRDRLAHFLQKMMERSAMAGAGGDPYFSPGMEYLPSVGYTDLSQEPLTPAQRLNDEHFIEVTTAVIKDMADAGNVVIDGRGSNMILKNAPGVFHVALIAPLQLRINTIVKREHFDWKDAEKYTVEMEEARVKYFRKFFKVHPEDITLYHMVLNMGTLSVKTAAEMVAQAAADLAEASTVAHVASKV